MIRNIFISFLGTSAYRESTYYFEDDISDKISYVQEYIVQKWCKDWESKDYFLVALTEQARRYNWLDKVKRFQDNEPVFEGDGLELVLNGLKEQGKIELNIGTIDIPDGDNETEIWQIFNCIESRLSEIIAQEPPETTFKLHLDITHSFRYIPILGVILANYLKVFNPKLEVTQIVYGNFEKGQAEARAKGTPNDIHSPIIDLTSFIELQNLTNVSNEFINLGDSDNFSTVGASYKALAEQLEELVRIIRTSRGGAILFEFDYQGLQHNIEEAKQIPNVNQAQVIKILEKIGERLAGFQNEEVKNGFIAVEWCIKYKLIPQGYTLLQETLMTWLLLAVGETDKIYHYPSRDKTGLALRGVERYRKDESGNFVLDKKGKKIDDWKDKIQLTKKMFDYVQAHYSEIYPYYDKLVGNAGFRNDINHAGFRPNPATPEALIMELEDLYTNFRRILKL